MIEKINVVCDVMKKHFNKKLAMTKKDNGDFKNSTKCWIWDDEDIHGDVKLRYNCHNTGKYKSSAH